MDSNYSDRLKDIQRRKEERERETRKKQFLVKRYIAAALCAAIIFLLVLGIKSCVNAISEKRSQKESEKQSELLSQTTNEPNTADTNTAAALTEGNIDGNFYKNSAFIGNSFIDGMEIYELVDGADYFARIGLNVKDAAILSTSTGDVAVIDELGGKKRYDKIFMMFGENELGWLDTDTFKSYYGVLIDKAREYQPNAEIYLLAITPITEAASNLNEDGATKENILRFNKLILEIAKEKNVNFADIFSAVADNRGYLPTEAASDGIHFDEKYYKKCLVYIQNVFSE